MNCFQHDENRLRTMARLAGRGRILDVGFMNCPNPYLSGPATGMDLFAQKKIPHYRHVIRGDAHHLPFLKGIFAAVVAGELIEHLFSPIYFLGECNRILASGGRLVLSTPNPHNPVEIIKNIFLRRPDIQANTHVASFPFQLMVKLAVLNGFQLSHFTGDYIRIPKLGIRIRCSWLPSICVHHIYAFEKTRDISPADFEKTWRHIHESERKRSLSIGGHANAPAGQ